MKNEYYESEEFKKSFEDLVELSRTHYQTGIEKGENLEGLAEDLYSEVGHYIYELLQNAEDCHATQVKFSLYSDSLVFSHNGPRYFTFEDIKAITTHGGGNKSLDSTKIGRFGIGFKSTSRITESPIIKSNQFTFKILNQVIPESVETGDFPGDANFATNFKFPFGTKKLGSANIHTETLATLKELDSKNLLFLEHLSLITINFGKNLSEKRVIGKKNIDENLVELKQSLDGTKESVTIEYFLRYDKSVDPKELDDWAKESKLEVEKKNGPLNICIAINALVDTSLENFQITGLRAIPESKLFVFFPAKKENTGLKFHIHAPFAATTTRESIKDSTPINSFLFSQFPSLLNHALSDLIKRKCLKIEGLEIFPNSGDEIRKELIALRDSIYNFFKSKEARIPVDLNSYSPYEYIREVASDLALLLDSGDLAFIDSFNTDSRSRNSALFYTQKPKNARAARFLSSLGVTTYGLRDLVVSFSHINNSMNSSKNRQSFVDWFSGHSIEWIKKFYILLSGFDPSRIRIYFNWTPIIKVNDEKQPFDIPGNSFITKFGDKSGPQMVSAAISNQIPGRLNSTEDFQISRFLEAVGVRQFSKSMMLQDKLSDYHKSVGSSDDSQNSSDDRISKELQQLISFVNGDTELERALSEERIFLTESYSGTFEWCKGKDVYIDSPFNSENGLNSVMHKLDAAAQKRKLWKGYVGIFGIERMLERLEVMTKVTAVKSGSGSTGEWSILGLGSYFEFANSALRKSLWNYVTSEVANRERHFLRFPDNFLNGSKDISELARKLKNTAWIPDKSGVLRLPSQIDRVMLPGDFKYLPCDFLSAIDFAAESEAAIKEKQENARNKQRKDEAALLFGAKDSDELDALVAAMKKDPKKMRKLLDDLNRPDLSDHLANPLMESEKVRSDLSNEPDVEMEIFESIQRQGSDELVRKRKDYLKSAYQAGSVIYCQICSTSSFVKTTNGEAFFVAIMVIESFTKNSIYNSIAVCGQCHAKFKYAKKTSDIELKSVILDKNDFAGTVKIPVSLAGETQYISFIESHFVKLRGALSTNN